MKKIFAMLAVALLLSAPAASAWNLKDALKGKKDTTSSTTKTSASVIGALIGGLFTSDRLSVADIAGSWRYEAPAVAFKNSKVLSALGNAAATSAADKLEPYYKAAGIDKMTITINADSTFQLTVRGVKLKGTVSPAVTGDTKAGSDAKANFRLSFTLFGAPVFSAETYVTKNAKGNISMMFDMEKLLSLLQTLSKFSSNQMVAKAADILKDHKDLCAGFELTETVKTTTAKSSGK